MRTTGVQVGFELALVPFILQNSRSICYSFFTFFYMSSCANPEAEQVRDAVLVTNGDSEIGQVMGSVWTSVTFLFSFSSSIDLLEKLNRQEIDSMDGVESLCDATIRV